MRCFKLSSPAMRSSLVLDNQLDILLDLVVIVLNSLLHAVVAIRIQEIVDDGDRLIMAFLSLYLVGVNDNLGMEDLLLYALGEVVGNRSTNIPWVSPLILLGGMRLSIWVLMDVETSWRLMEMDWRFWSTFPKRSDKVLAVSPTTWPLKMLPTVLITTLASLSP